MSLFSSLSPTDARTDQLSGLSYIQSLRAPVAVIDAAAVTRKTAAAPPPASNTGLVAPEQEARLHQHQFEERQATAAIIAGTIRRHSNAAGHAALASAASAQALTGTIAGVAATAVVQPPSGTSAPVSLRGDVLTGWGQPSAVDAAAEGQLASLLSVRRDSGGGSGPTLPSPLAKRRTARQSMQSLVGGAAAVGTNFSSGSQTARAVPRAPSYEPVAGSLTSRSVALEEKRNDASLPSSTSRVISSSASRPSASSSSSPSTRTLEDELLELEQERRARWKEKRARENAASRATAGSDATPTPLTQQMTRASHTDKKETITRFPRIADAQVRAAAASAALDDAAVSTVAPSAALSDADSASAFAAASLPAPLDLPFVSAGDWSQSTARMDLATHASLFTSRVSEYAHRLTQRLQANLANARRQIARVESASLANTRRALRDTMRFYHAHESRIFDVARGVRAGERAATLAELEEASLARQQTLIHEDYATQHAELRARLEALHAGRARAPHHDFLHAHSKQPDAQIARLAARRDSMEDGLLLAGHVRRLSRSSPQPPPPAAAAGSTSSPPAGAEGPNGASSGPTSRRASGRHSRHTSVETAPTGPSSTTHTRRPSRTERHDGRDRDDTASPAPLGTDATASSSSSSSPATHPSSFPASDDLDAKLDLLRAHWQDQFAAVRRARADLKELKSSLLSLERDRGAALEIERMKVRGLEAHRDQMQANHEEALGARSAELVQLREQHAQIEARATQLRDEEAELEASAARDAVAEEALWAQEATHDGARREVARANAAVARELTRAHLAHLRTRRDAARDARTVCARVASDLLAVVTCSACGYVIKSASVTWSTGETTCEKCAFQKNFPANFQSVVRAVHKQFAREAATKAATDNTTAASQRTSLESETVANSDSPSHLQAPALSPQLRSHLSPRAPSRSPGVDATARDDLGARLLEQMASASHEDASAAVGERIRRGSLGGVADALVAINDANTPRTAQNSSSATPTAVAANADDATDTSLFPASSSIPAPSSLSSPSSVPPRLLQELSEVNSTRVSPTALPFTLVWMKNRVVDAWLARFHGYQMQIDDLARQTQIIAPMIKGMEEHIGDGVSALHLHADGEADAAAATSPTAPPPHARRVAQTQVSGGQSVRSNKKHRS